MRRIKLDQGDINVLRSLNSPQTNRFLARAIADSPRESHGATHQWSLEVADWEHALLVDSILGLLAERGLRADCEPNEVGRALEDLLDRLDVNS